MAFQLELYRDSLVRCLDDSRQVIATDKPGRHLKPSYLTTCTVPLLRALQTLFCGNHFETNP